MKPNKFVVANKNIERLKGIYVEKNDIGMIESESKSENEFKIFFIRIGKKVYLNKNEFNIIDIKHTGDSFSKKICNVCHKLLDTSDFAKNQNGINNRSVRRPSCKNCRKDIEGVDMSTETKKEWSKSKPINQPFECPICLKRTIAGVTSKVVLDHDHSSGKARGWICDSCNTGIGRFKDDKKILLRAIKFLNKN